MSHNSEGWRWRHSAVSLLLSLFLASLLGLLLAAVTSALLIRHQRRQSQALAQQQTFQATLARYAVWAAALRSALAAGGVTTDMTEEAARGAQDALLRLQALQQRHFPALGPAMARLGQADAALREFLALQEHLRLHHAEAWLASGHEARLAQLARGLDDAVEALERALRQPQVDATGAGR